jgi:DNA-binding response OmpR family regulator
VRVEKTAVPSAVVFPKKPPSVLIVDDDVSLRKLFVTVLSRSGFDVDCACDGADGFDRIQAKDYAVVLLDLMMPNVNGFELLARLEREMPAVLQRIVVTTAVNNKIVDTVDRTKIHGVIRKPFDIDDLVAVTMRCASRNNA